MPNWKPKEERQYKHILKSCTRRGRYGVKRCKSIAAATVNKHRSLGMVGGKAHGMKPSDFDSKQLKRGTEVEMEHTSRRSIAKQIAMDHLVEDPQYYTKLARFHLDGMSDFVTPITIVGGGITLLLAVLVISKTKAQPAR